MAQTLWQQIKQAWGTEWSIAKTSWQTAWESFRDSIIAFASALGQYAWAIIQTVIILPLSVGIYQSGKLCIAWVINWIKRI